ncbi:MAG: hypothetical protein ACQXXF_06740 [Thermoplasmatota archaeon]|jgi:hypothetical protein
MRKEILSIIFSTVIITNCFCAASLNVSKKYNLSLNDNKNFSIIEDGQVNDEVLKELSAEFYHFVKKKIFMNNTVFLKQNFSFKDYELAYKAATYIDTSTIFTAPYSNCYSWGYGTPGVNECSYGSNKESGSIGAYTNAFVGGATAEAMQQLNLYIGRIKIIKVDAEIIRTGGKSTFGFAAFAGTEKTWSWDDFQKNYHRADVDPWWNWDDITFKIIALVSILIGFTPTSISQAITLLSQIINFKAFAAQMHDMLENDDAEIIHVMFNISLNPGWHSIWVGLRATSSGCLTGTGSAVTMGLVSQIKIDGIAPPAKPEVNGPSSGKTGSYTFSFVSIDPNNDKIQYIINWGDGQVSDYSDFYNSGEVVYRAHNYNNRGTYTITVKARDIDKMESKDYGFHTIKIDNDKFHFIAHKKESLEKLFYNFHHNPIKLFLKIFN